MGPRWGRLWLRLAAGGNAKMIGSTIPLACLTLPSGHVSAQRRADRAAALPKFETSGYRPARYSGRAYLEFRASGFAGFDH